MKIQNYSELANTPLRKKALDILSAGVDSVLPDKFMHKYVKFEDNTLVVCGDSYPLSNGRLLVIGGGKAAGSMAQALESIIPLEKITAGYVNAQVQSKTRKITVNPSGSPIPDEHGVTGVKEMLSLTSNLRKEDIVICLISGGGSALMPLPSDGITLEDKKKMNEILLSCGTDHYEINIVRKHLSGIKGGKLAKFLQPAKVISLILSDDFGGKGDVASGPTSHDESNFSDAYKILEKYSMVEKMPKSIIDYLKKGIKGEVAGNVPKNDSLWKNVHNYTLADNKLALQAMRHKAESEGFKVYVVEKTLEDTVNDVSAHMANNFTKSYETESMPLAILFSTETTVNVAQGGKGGRNQQFVASQIKTLANKKATVIASLDSDGVDFIRGVAGAIADDNTLALAKQKSLNTEHYIEHNNTFFLHEALGTLILSDPTGTNVGDLHVYLQDKSNI